MALTAARLEGGDFTEEPVRVDRRKTGSHEVGEISAGMRGYIERLHLVASMLGDGENNLPDTFSID